MDQSRVPRIVAATAAIAIFCLALAGVASAAETIYWNNFESNALAFANVDGSGGGAFNSAGAEVANPEGMAIDSATGRLYWSSPASQAVPGQEGAIFSAKLDGTGGGQILTTTAGSVDYPDGIAIDPANDTIYWANGPGESIGYARLDGSGGGLLNTTGTEVGNGGAITVDPADGRVYWVNYTHEDEIAYANLDGSGGGLVNLAGAPEPFTDGAAIAVDTSTDSLYYRTPGGIGYVSLAGGGGGELNIAGATYNRPYGFSISPVTNRIYWANVENDTTAEGALAYASLAGLGGGNLTPTTPVSGAQDPVIQAPPKAAGAPILGGVAAVGSTLSCSTGTWAQDLPAQFYYQAPTSYGYQWTLNGAPIAGAVGSTYGVSSAGTYACTVTAVNQAGATSQTSAGAAVAAPAPVEASVKVTKVKLNKKKGTATILATVSGPGKLALTGKNVVTAQGSAKGVAVVKLLVKAKGKGKKTLAKKGMLKVKVKIAFTPSGGGAKATTTKSFALKRQAAKKK